MIFDVKMDGHSNRKARIVTGGNTTGPPQDIKYSSVLTQESVKN